MNPFEPHNFRTPENTDFGDGRCTLCGGVYSVKIHDPALVSAWMLETLVVTMNSLGSMPGLGSMFGSLFGGGKR